MAGPWARAPGLGRLRRASSVSSRCRRPPGGAPLLTCPCWPCCSAPSSRLPRLQSCARQARLWYILAGLFLYDSLAFAPSRVRFGRLIVAPVSIFIALLPAVMALYFMTTCRVDPLDRQAARARPAALLVRVVAAQRGRPDRPPQHRRRPHSRGSPAPDSSPMPLA